MCMGKPKNSKIQKLLARTNSTKPSKNSKIQKVNIVFTILNFSRFQVFDFSSFRMVSGAVSAETGFQIFDFLSFRVFAWFRVR